MREEFFSGVSAPIPFGGVQSADPLTFKIYQADRIVLGRRMEDWLRIGVCLWHSFAWPGSDMFGSGTFERSFQHEVAYALANGMFGSVDANRGDYQNGWDTDQFPNSVDELSLALYEIVAAGGFTTGGFNFDAKLRRQSIDPDDLFHGHIGGIDTLARALLAAEAIVKQRALERFRTDRYARWDDGIGQSILSGNTSLEDLFNLVAADKVAARPVSGRQELLENAVNRAIWSVDASVTAQPSSGATALAGSDDES